MKIYLSKEDFRNDFLESMKSFQEYHWAVAWASLPREFGQLLKNNSFKIKELYVDYSEKDDDVQSYTSKSFYKCFKTNTNVHFLMNRNSSFLHSKLYLFKNNDEDWCCYVGSANFTRSGFGKKGNFEVMCRVSNHDHKSKSFLRDCNNFFKELKKIERI